MKYLFYYPMVHVSAVDQLPNFDEEIWKLLRDNTSLERFGQFKSLTDMQTYGACWEKFFGFLQANDPFDRFFLETYGKRISPRIMEGSVMKKCIDYIVGSGASQEITESDFWYQCCEYSPRRFKELFHRLREKAVVKNVSRRLLDGERGILLFGGGHEQNLVPDLSEVITQVDVYSEE